VEARDRSEPPQFSLLPEIHLCNPTPRQSRISTIYNLSPAQTVGKFIHPGFQAAKGTIVSCFAWVAGPQSFACTQGWMVLLETAERVMIYLELWSSGKRMALA
jgi:hypothetical protein